MDVQIKPEPSEEERRAILAALERDGGSDPYRSRWRASALDDLRDGAAAEEARDDAGVVEP